MIAAHRPVHDDKAQPESARLRDLGDRVCCALTALAAVSAFALLAWYVWQMPAISIIGP
jgi:hypothetical protein